MADPVASTVSECTPDEAWNTLAEDPTAQLIDVRTRPEWSFVGIPDLSPLNRRAILAEWRSYPDMTVNPHFADQVGGAFEGSPPNRLFFICRSGARSMEAARHMAQVLGAAGHAVQCVNVAEGFEGDLDGDRHRGRQNGWKARGLSWQQS